MKSVRITMVVLAFAMAVASAATQACGEGQFNMGQGLRYQGYLAPRPATVLIYTDPSSGAELAERERTYRGLEQAGHRVTVVSSAEGLSQAMASKQYDIVIASADEIDAVGAHTGTTAASPRLLPVIASSARNATQLRERFKLFLIDGASVGQYLKAINQTMAARAR